MRETLEGQLAEGPSCLTFSKGSGRGGGGRKGSGLAAERRRFMDAVARHCQVGGTGWGLRKETMLRHGAWH